MATLNQKWQSQALPSLAEYLHAIKIKILIDYFQIYPQSKNP